MRPVKCVSRLRVAPLASMPHCAPCAGLCPSSSEPLGVGGSRKSLVVGMKLLRTPPRWSASRTFDGPYGVHGPFQDLGVSDVCRRVDHRGRDFLPIANNVALGSPPFLCPSNSLRFFDPPGRVRSPSPKKPSFSRCGLLLPNGPRASGAALLHTPPCLVPFFEASPAGHIPDPQSPSPFGQHLLEGMPLFRTNGMPVRAVQSSMRACRRWAFGWLLGQKRFDHSPHSTSLTGSLAIPSPYPPPGFVRRTYPPSEADVVLIAICPGTITGPSRGDERGEDFPLLVYKIDEIGAEG